jgi:hypothetical protein
MQSGARQQGREKQRQEAAHIDILRRSASRAKPSLNGEYGDEVEPPHQML